MWTSSPPPTGTESHTAAVALEPHQTDGNNTITCVVLLCCCCYRLLSSGSLVLSAPSNQDEGYFECTAANEVGEERRVIEVILQGLVLPVSMRKSQTNSSSEHKTQMFSPDFNSFSLGLPVPPTIEDDVTAVTAVKMSPVVLPCQVQGRPQPMLTWTKSGSRLGARGGSYRVLPTGETTGSVMGWQACGRAVRERNVGRQYSCLHSAMCFCSAVCVSAVLCLFLRCCVCFCGAVCVSAVLSVLCVFLQCCQCCVCFYPGVLEIIAAVPSHAGRYTCSARNPAGTAHKHVTLTVHGESRVAVETCLGFKGHILVLRRLLTLCL